jgi:predicted Zn-dependent protease
MANICKLINTVLAQAFFLSWATQVAAFELNGQKWPTAETEFYVDIDGVAASGVSWNAAFIAAMTEWNDSTPFDFILREENRDPCENDGLNSVGFSDNACSSSFGENVLAITFRRIIATQLGGPVLTQADIVVNQNINFNIYDGNLVQFGIPGIDFRRVALHELGHALGLGHETNNVAIMAPDISNVDRLQADDIAGAEALYDPTIDCAVQQLSFGQINDALDASDCTVSELFPGSSDTSPIDLYRFQLSNSATLSLGMTSSTLDSVLLIADENLQIVGFDDNSGNTCDSTLTQFLQPGMYFLLANTFDVPVKDECGNSGEYQIDVGLSSNGINPLGSSTSLSGGASVEATFSGGISADNGLNFGNQFSSNDSLDISAQIEVDPQHLGQAGFLVMAIVVDQQLYFMNEQGQLVDSALNPGVITRAENKTLEALEELSFFDDLVPAALGIDEIVADFYFGYGLASNANELYYHQASLNLTVSP